MRSFLTTFSLPNFIFHVTDGGECSWHEFAVRIGELIGAKVEPKPCTSAEYGAALWDLLFDAGRPAAKEAAMAKLAASEAASFAADACVKTLGGYGYSPEYPAEKWLRDAKLHELWEGTSDIMRLIVARELLKD